MYFPSKTTFPLRKSGLKLQKNQRPRRLIYKSSIVHSFESRLVGTTSFEQYERKYLGVKELRLEPSWVIGAHIQQIIL